MIYIIIYTITTKPNPFYIIVDKLEDLAQAVDNIKKKGQDVNIKIYKAESVNYKFKYKDKEKTIIEKIPEIEIL